MNLLPFARATLTSELSPEELMARLQAVVRERSGWFSLTSPPEPFTGRIDGRRFKIMRVLGTFLGMRYRNSFQPVIVGEVSPATAGAVVHVRMRLHLLVAAFMCVWFGGLLIPGVMILLDGLRHGFGRQVVCGREAAGAGVGIAAIGFMVLLGYTLVSASFWPEVKKARHLLCEALSCRATSAQE